VAQHHYVSPKLEGREAGSKGQGLFAIEHIPADELLVVWAGFLVSSDKRELLTDRQISLSIMVEENLDYLPFEEEVGDWVNHSCDPNSWLVGQISLFSRREIEPGEEICFDYATCLGVSDPADEFDCSCGSPQCRHRVTANDWQIPELQTEYAGHFMPYLQRRIDKLKLSRNQVAQQ
jgi:hypothetical protein